MHYYDKFGRAVKDEDKATYWVADGYTKKFKRLIKQAKDAMLHMAYPEWAINRLRLDEPRSCGWVNNF